MSSEHVSLASEVKNRTSGVPEEGSTSAYSYEGPLDGGRDAWMTIAGGWLFQLCGFGFFAAYGVFQDFYVREFMTNKTPSEIAWIGGLEIALQYFLAFPIGMAFDAGYFHQLLIGGSVIYCFSLFMLSIAKPQHYYQVFLAQGVGMGIGLAMTFVPIISVVSHHFTRHRALALGILISGGSIGGIVFPIMLNRLIHGHQGFGTGVRAAAGMIAGLLAIANLLVRARYPPTKYGVSSKRISVSKLFKDPPYVAFVTGGFLLGFGTFYPVFYLQLFSVKHGINRHLAFYIVSFMNTGTFFGRIIANYFADTSGRYNLIIPAAFSSATLVLAILGIGNAAGAIVVALLYGVTNGARSSLTPAVLSDISDDISEIWWALFIVLIYFGTHGIFLRIRMGLYFTINGMSPLVAAPAALFGQPINGALMTHKLIWWRGILFSSICLTLGSVMMLLSRFLFIRKGGSQFQRI